MPSIGITYDTKGTLFSSPATAAATARLISSINEKLGQESVNRIRLKLDRVLKHPTGYYRAHIVSDKRGNYQNVNDGGVVYGGWLEGVTSRNRATRFKGYQTFRTVRQSIDKDKYTLATPLVQKFIREMNR